MPDQSTEPRPHHDAFARFLAACATATAPQHTIEAWMRGWNGRAIAWTNLRHIEHWIERSRP
jgi:hypothetical protein